MAGDAGIGSHGGVASDLGLKRDLGGGEGMRAGGPIGQGVDVAAHLPGRIVAGQAHLAIGTVSDQEILRDQVLGLHMRIMARGALDVASNQPYRSGRVGGLVARRQRGNQIDTILQRQREAERVRRLHVAVEDVSRVHRPLRGDLAIGYGVSDRHGSVMAAQASIAVGAEPGLPAAVPFGIAQVSCIGLCGQLLVPEARIQAGVRRMTVGAGVRTSAGDGRFTDRPQIMHAQHIARELGQERAPAQQHRQPGQPYSEPHFISSAAGFFKPTY